MNTRGSGIVVRNSDPTDIVRITNIYSNEVLHGLASFEFQPPIAEEMARRRNNILGAGYPYLVACVDNKVAGYAYASAYRPRPAYQFTVENSVYVAKNMRQAGIGKALLAELIKTCECGPWRTMIAVIGDRQNTESIGLHKSLGFRQVGIIEATGYKLNQWVDTVLMQRNLNLNPIDTTQPTTGPSHNE